MRAPSFWCLIAGMTTGLLFTAGGFAQSGRPCGGRDPAPALVVAASPRTSGPAAPLIPYRVTARYPRDTKAFTQGLVFHQGQLYESTGIRGRSDIRRIDLHTGRILDRRPLDAALFGEGLTVLDGRLVQLTWQSGSAFIYDPADLRRLGDFSLAGEGWGSTVVAGRLVVSDGTSWLKFFAGDGYREVERVQVTDGGRPVEGLNELEAVGETVYANVYPSDCIARIDARSGQVLGWLDLAGLMPLSQRPDTSAVANGIAYHAPTGALLVTGKLWPYLYRLMLPDTQALPDEQAVVPGGRLSRR